MSGATFVLVHGAFHGGWCWGRAVRLLEEAGAAAYAPTLAGLGERSGGEAGEVGLADHIDDVVSVIEGKGLRNVVLVGHSYGGIVIAGTADRIAERLKCIVYLDAIVPEDGQSLADIKGQEWRDGLEGRSVRIGRGWYLPSPKASAFDIHDKEDAAWADAHLTPHPLKTFTDHVSLTNPAVGAIRHVYIACTEQEDSFVYMRGRVTALGWRWIEIPTGHDAMITAPGRLTEILLSLAGNEAD